MSFPASTPVPGSVWESPPQFDGNSVLRILRITARRASDNDHFVLTRDNVPIGPPTFSSCTGAIMYAEKEWLGLPQTAMGGR